MAWVTVGLGQCGSQVAGSLYGAAAEELPAWGPGGGAAGDAFFRESPSDPAAPRHARCVLVDMEPKVVNSTLAWSEAQRGWRFDRASSFAEQSGSANNWAHGFNVHGPRRSDDALDRVRREVECCDALDGLLLLQSLAGGTGSGFGAYLAHELADAYGAHAQLVSAAVWPRQSGEVIVQHMNTLLSVTHLLECVDAAIILQNDQLAEICRRRLGVSRASFRDMNSVVADQLACQLLPLERRIGQASLWEAGAVAEPEARCPLGEAITDAVPLPSHRLLDIKLTPQVQPAAKAFTTHAWPSLARQLRQMHATGAHVDEQLNYRARLEVGHRAVAGVHRCLAASVTLRGAGAEAADPTAFITPAVFRDGAYASNLAWRACRHPFRSNEKTISVLSNDQGICRPLRRVCDRAQSMLAAGAYVHHFARHGVDNEWFRDSLAVAEQTVMDYEAL